jgi:hypothetical protein
MLRENPQKRPNIYEVVQEMCHMQGKEVPIRDVRAIFYYRYAIFTNAKVDLLEPNGFRDAKEPGVASNTNRCSPGGSSLLAPCRGNQSHP